ncbi:cytochrome c3 family protein [Kaarinaea lacus]
MRKLLFILLYTSLTPVSAHDSCSNCHINPEPNTTDFALHFPMPQLCVNCHPDRIGAGEHIINVAAPSNMTMALPLSNGLVTCITCHDPHVYTPSRLRVDKQQLCSACHQN